MRYVSILTPADSIAASTAVSGSSTRSEEHTSELQSRLHLVCRLLLEKKNIPHLFYSRGMLILGQSLLDRHCRVLRVLPRRLYADFEARGHGEGDVAGAALASRMVRDC